MKTRQTTLRQWANLQTATELQRSLKNYSVQRFSLVHLGFGFVGPDDLAGPGLEAAMHSDAERRLIATKIVTIRAAKIRPYKLPLSITGFIKGRLNLFAWCVRLSRLLVGFRTHFKSLHFLSFFLSFYESTQLNILDEWTEYVESGGHVICTDISQAFDKVPHKPVIHILYYIL